MKDEKNRDSGSYGWNFAMGLLHGIFYNGGIAFSNVSTVLPVFLDNFTTSKILLQLDGSAGGNRERATPVDYGSQDRKPNQKKTLFNRGHRGAIIMLGGFSADNLFLRALFTCIGGRFILLLHYLIYFYGGCRRNSVL